MVGVTSIVKTILYTVVQGRIPRLITNSNLQAKCDLRALRIILGLEIPWTALPVLEIPRNQINLTLKNAVFQAPEFPFTFRIITQRRRH